VLTFVSTPVGFVGDEEDAISEVTIELSNDFFSGSYLERMGTEDPLQATDQRSFASTLSTDKNQCHFCRLGRMLDRPSNPVPNVVCEFFISSGDDFDNVFVDQAPVPRRRLATPALPKVEAIVDDARPSGKKQDASVLTAVPVIEPPVAQSHVGFSDSTLTIRKLG